MAQVSNNGNFLSLFYHWSLGLSLDPFASNRDQNRILFDVIVMSQVPNIIGRRRNTTNNVNQETQTGTGTVTTHSEETVAEDTEEEPDTSVTDPNSGTDSQTLLSIAQENDFRIYVNMMENIFLSLLILVKLFYEYKLGALMLIALTIICHQANKVIKAQVARRENVQPQALFQILTAILVNIILIYTSYESLGLYYSLLLLPLRQQPKTLWSMLWCIAVTDFVLKMFAMILKIACIFFPVEIMPIKFKERYYVIIEETSQLHRCLATVTPWMILLISMLLSSKLVDKLIGCLLMIVYLPLKMLVCLLKYADVAIAISQLTNLKPLWALATPEQLIDSDGICPICFECFNEAAILICNHVFCRQCISQWFEQERTCPICRYQVMKDLKWRDGSTLLTIQLF